MNVTASILDKVKNSKVFPMTVTSEDYPIIEESAIIVEALEGDGYKVETFVDWKNATYGLRISK